MQEQTLNLKWYTFGEKKPEIRILKPEERELYKVSALSKRLLIMIDNDIYIGYYMKSLCTDEEDNNYIASSLELGVHNDLCINDINFNNDVQMFIMNQGCLYNDQIDENIKWAELDIGE